MPELPEVESIARSLRLGGNCREPIVGRTVRGTQILWERSLAAIDTCRAPAVEDFRTRMAGQVVTGVGRREKFLVIGLSNDSLLIHLRMSGDLRVEPGVNENEELVPLQPHDRVVIDFTDGWRMVFNDTRKFGRVWLVRDLVYVLGELGPEPFDPQFTAQELFHRLQQVKRQVKPLLLDQAFLAGMGNIYTDEALHIAGIHPLRLSNSLSPEEAGALWDAIRAVLSEGIERNGASIDWVYRGGDFQNYFRVYQRTGQPCLQCGAPIERMELGQRGTHFCPVCQRLPEKDAPQPS
jgi:formamidopyrimidine-DNA glycosylase